MKLLGLAALLLTLAATGCGTTARPAETPQKVAAFLRSTWGSTKGFPTFDYSCHSLDGEGHLFTCLVRDPTRTVRVASFDVECVSARCSWRYYPAYTG